MVHAMALALEQKAKAAGTEPAALAGEFAQALAKHRIAHNRRAANRLRVNLSQPAGATLRQPVIGYQPTRCCPPRRRRRQFLAKRSFSR